MDGILRMANMITCVLIKKLLIRLSRRGATAAASGDVFSCRDELCVYIYILMASLAPFGRDGKCLLCV